MMKILLLISVMLMTVNARYRFREEFHDLFQRDDDLDAEPKQVADTLDADVTSFMDERNFRAAPRAAVLGPLIDVPEPHCGKVCPEILEPVCGSDGKLYESECILRLVACKTDEEIAVVECEEWNKNLIPKDKEILTIPNGAIAKPCDIDNGGCSHTCENKGDVAVCSCPVGYIFDDDKKKCSKGECIKFWDTLNSYVNEGKMTWCEFQTASSEELGNILGFDKDLFNDCLWDVYMDHEVIWKQYSRIVDMKCAKPKQVADTLDNDVTSFMDTRTSGAARAKPCDNANGGCSHTCENKGDVAVCSCPAGYLLDDDQKKCSKGICITLWETVKRNDKAWCTFSNGKSKDAAKILNVDKDVLDKCINIWWKNKVIGAEYMKKWKSTICAK